MIKYKSWLFSVIFLFLSLAPASGYASSYVYDELNRLTEVALDSGTTLLYSYDASGNLVSVRSKATAVVSASSTQQSQLLKPEINRALINGDFESGTLAQQVGLGWESFVRGKGVSLFKVVKVSYSLIHIDSKDYLSSQLDDETITGAVYGIHSNRNLESVNTNADRSELFLTQSQRLSLQGDSNDIAGVKQEVTVSGNESYRLAASIYSLQLNNAKTQIHLAFYDKTGRVTGDKIISVSTHELGWHSLDEIIQVPSDTERVQIELQLKLSESGGSGSVLFDNIVFKQS